MELKPGYKQTEVGVIPEDWEIKQLGEIVSYTNGKAHENCIKDYGQYVVANSKFISSEGETKKYSDDCFCPAAAGDVLMVMSDVPNGKAIAKCFLVDKHDYYTVNQRICALNPTQIDGKFLFYKLNRNPFYLAFDDGAKQTNLRKDEVLSCPLGIPKSRTEQRAVAAALSDVDALIASLEKLIAKKRDIKQAAVQQLLTGKRRLPGFQQKAGVRHTEVGMIPEDWEVDTVASTTPLSARNGIVDGPFGSNLKTIHYKKSGIPIVTSGYVTDGIFRASHYLYVDAEKFKEEKRSAVKAGDIVMAKIGERCGASAILPAWHDTGILSGNALKITVDNSRHSTYYIWQVLWNLYSHGKVESLKTIGAQPAISMANLKKYRIPLPALPEQQAIAAVLSDLEAEISALEARRDKTKLLKQGMMQELLTGRIRLL